MKLSEQTLEDMHQFFFDDHGSGEGSLADRGCHCFQMAPCTRCTHPGNPVCIDATEAWASPEDAGAYSLFIRETSAFLRTSDFKWVRAEEHEFARWVDYANRVVTLKWDFEENCPLFQARYGMWRTVTFATAEAAFVAAELDNWGRSTPLHELARMAQE